MPEIEREGMFAVADIALDDRWREAAERVAGLGWIVKDDRELGKEEYREWLVGASVMMGRLADLISDTRAMAEDERRRERMEMERGVKAFDEDIQKDMPKFMRRRGAGKIWGVKIDWKR